MSTRLKNIVFGIIGFILLIIMTYTLYHLGINFGRLISKFL